MVFSYLKHFIHHILTVVCHSRLGEVVNFSYASFFEYAWERLRYQDTVIFVKFSATFHGQWCLGLNAGSVAYGTSI